VVGKVGMENMESRNLPKNSRGRKRPKKKKEDLRNIKTRQKKQSQNLTILEGLRGGT